MSEQEFDTYLALLAGMLRLDATQRESISEELRDHMIERMHALMVSGVSRDKAIQLALEEFGDVSRLASGLTAAATLERRRRIMRWTLGTVLTSGFVLFFAMMLWPNGDNGPTPQGAIAQEEGHPDPKVDKASETTKDKEPDLNEITFAKLQKITTIEYIDTPLDDVLENLGEELKMQIFLDVRGLDEAGIEPDIPVTVKLENVPAYLGFELMLQQLELGFTVKEGLIIVSSADAAESSAVVRYYKVDDLLPLFKQGAFALDNNGAQDQLEALLRSRRRAGPRQESTYNQAIVNLIAATRIEPSPNRKLVEHLKELIEPSGWMNGGGTNGMSAINGILVASCPVRVHIEIENTLKRLRRVKGSITLPQTKARERSPFELDKAPTHSPIYGEGGGIMGGASSGRGGGMGGRGGVGEAPKEFFEPEPAKKDEQPKKLDSGSLKKRFRYTVC